MDFIIYIKHLLCIDSKIQLIIFALAVVLSFHLQNALKTISNDYIFTAIGIGFRYHCYQ